MCVIPRPRAEESRGFVRKSSGSFTALRMTGVLFFAFIILHLAFVAAPPAFADITIVPDDCYDQGDYSLGSFLDIAQNIMKFVWSISGAFALLMFFFGGILWLVSAGEDKRVTQGRETMIQAATGLIIVLGSWVFVNFVVAVLTGSPTNTTATIFHGKAWSTYDDGPCLTSYWQRAFPLLSSHAPATITPTTPAPVPPAPRVIGGTTYISNPATVGDTKHRCYGFIKTNALGMFNNVANTSYSMLPSPEIDDDQIDQYCNAATLVAFGRSPGYPATATEAAKTNQLLKKFLCKKPRTAAPVYDSVSGTITDIVGCTEITVP